MGLVVAEKTIRGTARKSPQWPLEVIEVEIEQRDRPYDYKAQDRIGWRIYKDVEEAAKELGADTVSKILEHSEEVRVKIPLRYYDLE